MISLVPHSTVSASGDASGPLVARLHPFPWTADLFAEANWRDLERRSLHSNPFLSQPFVLPQSGACPRVDAAHLLTVTDQNGLWLAAGLFEPLGGSRQFPLPHLHALQTEHTFLGGLLVDRDHGKRAVAVLWNFLAERGIHALHFDRFPIDSALADLLTSHCAAHQLATTIDDLHSRASLNSADGATTVGISEKREKSLRKGRRALAKHGRVSMRVRAGSRDDRSAVDQFLYLESLGWKGDSGTAMASCVHDSEWFRKAAASLSDQDRIYFAELLIDDRVIASMCLLRAQSDYFAFKMGWDPQFERGGPGFLLAAELRSHIDQLPGCERIDSCARSGSFLEHVWPGRMPVASVVFTTDRMGSVAATGTRWARNLVRRWRGQAQAHAHIGEPGAVRGMESGE